MAIARFTEAWVRGAPLGQWTDATLRGFMCQVGTTRTTWYAQALVGGGRQTRVRVGHWPDVPQADARRMAAEVLASMRRGEDPREAERARRARATTLAEAMEGHFRPGHSPRTVEGYRYNLEHYLPDWMGREVEAIGRDRAGVRARHRQIAARNGPTTADHVMRALRAVYNRARREHPDLPPNPVENVDFHARRRRRVDLSPDLLLAWGGAVLALASVRRDLALFTLLTGMRRTAGSEARIEHLDLAGGRLRVPNPKGGEERAFDLPLSAPLRDLLAARAGARTKGWLFQSRRGGGHAFEVRFEGSGGLQGQPRRRGCEPAVDGHHRALDRSGPGRGRRRLDRRHRPQRRAPAGDLRARRPPPHRVHRAEVTSGGPDFPSVDCGREHYLPKIEHRCDAVSPQALSGVVLGSGRNCEGSEWYGAGTNRNH